MRRALILVLAALIIGLVYEQPQGSVRSVEPPRSDAEVLDFETIAWPVPMALDPVPAPVTTTTTIAPPPTTTTVAPPPEPEPEVQLEPETVPDVPSGAPDVEEPSIALSGGWEALVECESGGDPQATSAGGTYSGLVQFDQQTWRSVGGSGRAGDASAAEQLMRAQMLYEQRGASPWPNCGRYLR